MPMDHKRYPSDWAAISLATRTADQWRCRFCGAANGQPHPKTGSKVVLTVAHLGTVHHDGRPGDKHDKQDVRPENLASLCQRCHLRYDIDEHSANARATRTRKRLEKARSAGQLLMIEG